VAESVTVAGSGDVAGCSAVAGSGDASRNGDAAVLQHQCSVFATLLSQQGSAFAAFQVYLSDKAWVAQYTRLCPLSSNQDSTLEYLQRRRLHNLSGQPVPGLHHPQSEEVFLMFRRNFLCFSLCPLRPLSCRWALLKRVWPHPPDTHPSDICKHLLGPLATFSSSG